MYLLTVENLKTHYFMKAGIIKAVDGVSFSLKKGQSIGIAGESGCGKSTIALSLMRLVKGGKTVSGEIKLNGVSLLDMSEKEFNRIRWEKISIISQAAMGALNPVYTIGYQIVEAIQAHRKMKKSQALELARELLEKVEIDPTRVKNFPHELSGGMRQRAMIAMALALNPEVIIADEPTTALDVVIQAQMIKLLKKLQKEMDLSIIFISHDLSILAQICDKVLIMYAGKIMEMANAKDLFKEPLHPYTKALISAFPNIDGERKKIKGLQGNTPDLLNPPTGCKFHPRCVDAQKICITNEACLKEMLPNRFVNCHTLPSKE
jgi:peptide/nickel transport system ATP-binding protein